MPAEKGKLAVNHSSGLEVLSVFFRYVMAIDKRVGRHYKKWFHFNCEENTFYN